ncbi:MAG TPA: hypothetical protein VM324_11160 [Egibacteraceae bacterium]|nr:hypothetical protein [Egibacteraceae bacterium]
MRVLLALVLIVAGVGHFLAHDAYLRLIPPWLPAGPTIVWVTGVAEIVLGVGLLALPRRRRAVGWALAAFLVLVFPGNVHQAVAGIDVGGLDTPVARWVRVLLQPPLIAVALWSTGAWPPARRRPTARTAPRSR